MEQLYKNSFLIKVVAVTTMIIDHIGAIFFPHVLLLRIIGRLSFPLFAYLVTKGFDRTRDKKIYLLRMFCFFIISQVPYILVFADHTLNIFATLLFGLIIIWISEIKKLDLFKKASLLFLLMFIAFILPLDYGIAGIICIIIFHTLKDSYTKLFTAQTVLWLTYIVMLFVNAKLSSKTLTYPKDIIQIIAPLSIYIIWIMNRYYSTKDFWNITKTKKYIIQYGFYIFYPMHLLILYGISIVIK